MSMPPCHGSRILSLLALAGGLVLGGCQSKPVSYAALLDNPDGGSGRIVLRGPKGEQTLDRAKTAAPLDGSQPAAPLDEAQLQRDFGAALAARPSLPQRYLLYFESGGTTLTAESAALLPRIVEEAARRAGVDVSIIGHSDTVGAAAANAMLALKRAEAVAALLKDKGMTGTAPSIASHGEANLLIKTPDETPEPRNRRVEVTVR
jgi:outer membrane protein OmpA-like peptidoglycan-associated protein